jgi:predicted small lipoprotein YifL
MNIQRGFFALLLALLLAALTACGAAEPAATPIPPTTAPEPTEEPATATPQPIEVAPSPTAALPPTELPTKSPSGNTSEPGENVTGEVPTDLMDKIMADLAQRSGRPRSEFTEVIGAAVEWSDGSLGCPQPGQMYPQVITPGYHVVLRVDDVEYDYRATTDGFFFLCSPSADSE